MEYKEEDYLMLSGIQHFIYCRRQWALIHIEQQWAENYQTTSGIIMHKRAHKENLFERRGDIITSHGLRIFSRKLGVSGQCDIVEFHKTDNGITLQGYDEQWRIIPIEYKRGHPKDGIEDIAQLCLQALCLEEMFCTNISNGFLYYGEERHRTEVIFSPELRKIISDNVVEMHQLFTKGHTPKVKETNKCRACSLKEICLPKLRKVSSVSTYISTYLKEE